MASFSRSFKPSSCLSSRAGRRPGMPGRSLSNMSSTSEVSSAASSPGEFNAEDIVFSAKPSPSLLPGSPKLGPVTKRVGDLHLKLPDSPRSSRSHPIAIELPTAKKPNTNSTSVHTPPPAALTGRGDLPGGYFPLHEEQNRVHRVHPFNLDATQVQLRSAQRGSQPSSPQPLPPVSAPSVIGRANAPPAATVPLPAAMSHRVSAQSSAASTANANTPVASYIPSGVHANPLPMGKYYPSNYESRKQQDQYQHLRPPGLPAAAVKSDTQVPTYRGDPTVGHSRNESEAKRRLQQYQRDMIAQATLALNGGNVNAAALNAISLGNLGFSGFSTGKPNAPKLAPLGSPGPVTPMDLESTDDGYLGVRLPISEDNAQVEEVVRAIRAEEERRRREGASSPIVEPGHMF